MPGIVAVAKMRVVAGRVLCELRHIERPDGDRPGVLEPLDRCCRISRPECAANLGAAPARLTRPVVHVLVRERHAVEGAEQPAGLAQPVEALGGLQCLLRLEGITRVDRRVAGLEGVERGLGEGDSGNLALAHRLARLDQCQTHERGGALPRRLHGVRSFVSCSAASKLDGSSSNASCPRARSNPWTAAANSRAKLWPTAFGGAIPDQNFACSSIWRSMSLLIAPPPAAPQHRDPIA